MTHRPYSGRIVLLAFVVVIGGAGWFTSYLNGQRRRIEKSYEDNVAAEAREFLVERKVQPLEGPVSKIVEQPASRFVPSQSHPLRGKPAPDFELSDHLGKAWTLRELNREGPVLLIFYYGYFCSHCVGQLFAVHEDIEKFKELGVRVVAVSPDPAATTQERFKTYGGFAFPVLSDPGNRIAALYGTYLPPKEGGKDQLLHGTFVIARGGEVRWVQFGEAPFTDNATLLHEFSKLK